MLADLARISLDTESLKKLNLSDESLLDHKASLAASMLSEKFKVPNSLKRPLSDCTVYHLSALNRRQAQSLWDAGFRDVDEFDEFGHSPLIVMMRTTAGYNLNSELVEWLVSKGANLDRRQAYAFAFDHQEHLLRSVPEEERAIKTEWTSYVTAAHYLALFFGRSFRRAEYWARAPDCFLLNGMSDEISSEMSSKVWRVFRKVLCDSPADCCACACSIGGCHPYTTMVKTIISGNLHYLPPLSFSSARKLALRYTEAVADLLDINQPRSIGFRQEMLRFNTFAKLRPRHTCCSTGVAMECSGNYWRHQNVIVELDDEEERREIREEQAETVQKLEELLLHFEKKYDEMAIPFVDFLRGYWKDHMKEFARTRYSNKSINVKELESLGVTVHATDYASTDASEDEERMEEVDTDDSGVLDVSEDEDRMEELDSDDSDASHA